MYSHLLSSTHLLTYLLRNRSIRNRHCAIILTSGMARMGHFDAKAAISNIKYRNPIFGLEDIFYCGTE
jgi:hypothetical protein